MKCVAIYKTSTCRVSISFESTQNKQLFDTIILCIEDR